MDIDVYPLTSVLSQLLVITQKFTQNRFYVLDAYKPSYHICLFPLQVVSWEIFVHLGSVHAEEWGSLNLVCK